MNYTLKGGEQWRDGKLHGWTGRKCATCKGLGERYSHDQDSDCACSDCGGTGQEWGLMPVQPGDETFLLTECRPPESTPSGTWHWLRSPFWGDVPCQWNAGWLIAGELGQTHAHDLARRGYTYLGPVQPYAPQDGSEAMREAARLVETGVVSAGGSRVDSRPHSVAAAIRALPLPSTEDRTHAR